MRLRAGRARRAGIAPARRAAPPPRRLSAAAMSAGRARSPDRASCRAERAGFRCRSLIAADDVRIARPQHRRPRRRARATMRERGAPGAAADDRQTSRLSAVRSRLDARSGRGGARSSSGQRGRSGASSPSTRPRRSRSSPAQAIIAPLSVHSAGGGATKRSPACRASAAKRSRKPLVGGDAAGRHQACCPPDNGGGTRRSRSPCDRPAYRRSRARPRPRDRHGPVGCEAAAFRR